jgi:nicotinamidase-related amidase
MLLSAESSVLLVVDAQQRLAPAIHDVDRVVRTMGKLIDGAAVVGVPVVATEHYSRGLGHTVAELTDRLPAGCVIEKLHLSAAHEPGFIDRLNALGRNQIVVTGMEAHVCVLQSALGLRGAGFQIFVVADAVGSRLPANRDLGLDRLRANGVDIVSAEMVLFEWAYRGDTPQFRDLLPLIKE